MKKIKQTLVIGSLMAFCVSAVQVVTAVSPCGFRASELSDTTCALCVVNSDCDRRYAYSNPERTAPARVLCECGQATETCKDGTTQFNVIYYKKRTCTCSSGCNSCTTVNDGYALNVYQTATSNTDCVGG
jgi:hypothetical protein